jgi:hypothetical protein
MITLLLLFALYASIPVAAVGYALTMRRWM